jgi:hypothetical protein
VPCGGVVATFLENNVAPKNHGWVHKTAFLGKQLADLPRVTRIAQAGEALAVSINQIDGSAEHGNFWMGFQKGYLSFKALRMRDIIGVHPRDVAAAREAKPAVERGDQAKVAGIAFQAQARINNILQYAQRSVGRAIVDHQEFKVGVSLRENALHCLSDVALRIVGWYQDGDGR